MPNEQFFTYRKNVMTRKR